MTYTPINWQNGDTITAEKLNKMDNGWSVETATETIFSETATTEPGDYGNEATLAYSQMIEADTLVVTFNGTDYTCQKIQINDFSGYGGVTSNGNYDFSTYPFALVSTDSDQNILATETAGTYTVAAKTVSMSIETSTEFSSAAQAAVPLPFLVTLGTTTWSEVNIAVRSGKIAYIIYNDGIANHPIFVEVVLCVTRANYTVYTVGVSDGALVANTYTASSASGVLS